MTKAYAGALEGTGAAELLMAQLGDAGGYVASERIEGTLAGRTGTFVVPHGAVGDATDSRTFGHVVPGSGTGGLEALRGDASFAHERLTLSYSL